MRPSHRGLYVLAAALIACCSAVSAGEPVTTADFESEGSQPSLIQRLSHLFQAAPAPAHGGVVQYGMTSPYYSHWQSPDLYTDDMRCRPIPWAPRGYGWPKKTSCVRMDYAPYGLQETQSIHGPALWPRIFRTPCCDCEHSSHCNECGDARSYGGYAPRQP